MLSVQRLLFLFSFYSYSSLSFLFLFSSFCLILLLLLLSYSCSPLSYLYLRFLIFVLFQITNISFFKKKKQILRSGRGRAAPAAKGRERPDCRGRRGTWAVRRGRRRPYMSASTSAAPARVAPQRASRSALVVSAFLPSACAFGCRWPVAPAPPRSAGWTMAPHPVQFLSAQYLSPTKKKKKKKKKMRRKKEELKLSMLCTPFLSLSVDSATRRFCPLLFLLTVFRKEIPAHSYHCCILS